MSSILTEIKEDLGIEETVTHFDSSIIRAINTGIFKLAGLGVVTEGYKITSSADTWDEMLDERTDLEAVKSFLYLNVKLIFDPPPTSFAIESINKVISEYEFRLNTKVEGDDDE
jgi:hypothetical protein